ncbi:MAG: serine/threonine protein kinase [Myxococcales bacterium]|nr:serine/threonine protein kinase [Myxococcales bacterium]
MDATLDSDRTRTSAGVDAVLPAPAEADERPPGSALGGYVLLRRLGAGGMGVVYTAYHGGLDRMVALKVVRDGGGAAGRTQTLREARALARLSHPNVVHVYEVGEASGEVYVAMELVEGEPLDRWQSAAGRTLRERLDAYAQAARGLQAAHQAGLVHRDFKPSNVIVGADGRVRVRDFGLARAQRTLGEDDTRPRALASIDLAQSLDGAIAGTPAYMSPEQFAGLEVDARSDVFSFAVALWESLYGERPYGGRTFEELKAAVTGGERRPPPAGVALPGRLRLALERGVEADLGRRAGDLGALLEALAIDPDADPSAAARERRIVLGALVSFMVLVVAPTLTVVALDASIDRRMIHALLSTSGVAMIAGLSFAYRRTLLRNTFHRRTIAVILALSLMVSLQRFVGLTLDAPEQVIIVDSALLAIAVLGTGALLFARWMAVPAGLVVLALIAAALFPGISPAGMAVVGPLIIGSFGVLWHRASADARPVSRAP